MRFLASFIVALTLVWPVPLAMPAALAVPSAPGHSNPGHAMSGDTAHHGDQAIQPTPNRDDIDHMADCCIGTACFGFGLTEIAGAPLAPPRVRPLPGVAAHLMAVSHPPDLPPPRL
jgi:hypothetical protein